MLPYCSGVDQQIPMQIWLHFADYWLRLLKKLWFLRGIFSRTIETSIKTSIWIYFPLEVIRSVFLAYYHHTFNTATEGTRLTSVALIDTPLFAPSTGCMNFLEC